MNNFLRIFRFDENNLNSSSSSSDNTSSTEFIKKFATSSTTQSTPSVSDSSMKSSETAAPSHSETHGIFEDHPGLNPSSERIVELQNESIAQIGCGIPSSLSLSFFFKRILLAEFCYDP